MPSSREDRHQASREGVELLFGVPDETDFVLVARAEADFVVESVRGGDALLVQSPDHMVVLPAVSDGGAKRMSKLTTILLGVTATITQSVMPGTTGTPLSGCR